MTEKMTDVIGRLVLSARVCVLSGLRTGGGLHVPDPRGDRDWLGNPRLGVGLGLITRKKGK